MEKEIVEITEIGDFGRLKIREAEEAAYNGWHLNLSEQENLIEICNALGKTPFAENEYFNTIFLENNLNSENITEEIKLKLKEYLKGKKWIFIFSLSGSSLQFFLELNEDRRKLLTQWEQINVKENIEKFFCFMAMRELEEL